MNFNDMSIAKLREFAKANGIKLQSATKKADIVAILEEATQSQPVAEATEQEVIRSGAEDSREIREEASEEAKLQQRLMQEEIADQKPALTDETVCVYSERKYSSTKLGKLDLGYNIVTKKNGMIWVSPTRCSTCNQGRTSTSHVLRCKARAEGWSQGTANVNGVIAATTFPPNANYS